MDERLTYFLVRVKRFVDNFLKKNSHFPPYFFTKFAIFFLIDIFSNSIVAVYLTSRKYIDFFALLPDNLSLKILSYLDPKSLLALTKVFSELFFQYQYEFEVSTLWQTFAENNDLWKSHVEKANFPITRLYDSHWFINFNIKFNFKLTNNSTFF